MPTNIEPIKILIVEDDVFIAENLKLTLENLGYIAAEPCATTKEAINALENETFDLAILDIQLFGKEEGIILGKTIAAQYKIPFIFLTAFSDANTVSKAALAGPSAYLVKPASQATLFATIQTALHNFHNQTIPLQIEETPPDTFFVKSGNKLYRVNWSDVVCIESGKNYALIKTSDPHIPVLPMRGSLQQTMHLIPGKLSSMFVQINRACCIQASLIMRLEKDTVVTSIGKFLLGDSFRKSLLDRVNLHD